MDEDKQIEAAQVQAMSDEYKDLNAEIACLKENNLAIYLVIINKKTGECRIKSFDK